MIWQLGGHSGAGAPGEYDATNRHNSFLGRRFLSWMDRHVRGQRDTPAAPRLEFFRDWVGYDKSEANADRTIAKAYVGRASFSQKPTDSLFFSGADKLTENASKVSAGSASYSNTGPAATSYSETSGVEGSTVDGPIFDGPGTFVDYTSPRLTRSTALVGSPTLKLHLDAPVAEAAQSSGADGKLILFAKVYDVAPDVTPTLQNRLISPVRVADVTKPVSIRLPGVVQQLRRGHRIQVVIAASDMAYANNSVAQPVTVRTSPNAPSVLRLPLTNGLRF